MSTHRQTLLAAAATAMVLAAAPALAQGGGVAVLIEQASFWRAQGQPARAAAVLDRVLLVHPGHPDALVAAALAQAELGQAGAAEDLLARLRQAAPGDVRMAAIEAALRGTRAGEASGNASVAALAASPATAAGSGNPEDPAALGALGVARLRQGRPAEARDLLLRASAMPAAAPRWTAALEEAFFALELSEGRGLMAAGAADAWPVLARAARREVAGRAEAEALLGMLALDLGDLPEAEARFRAANYRRPGLPVAQEGLLETLRRQGRIAEAEALAREPGTPPRAEALRSEAARTEDPEAALALLRQALLAAPSNPGVRLDLARLLARQGRAGEARALMEAAAGPRAELVQAMALFAEEDGRPADALRLLEGVPDRLRSADHTRFVRSLRLQAELAAALSRPPAEARGAVLAIAGRPDPGGEAALRAVRALLRAGEQEAALEAARLAAGRNTALRLALAEALGDARMTAEAAALTLPLVAEGGLAPVQRRRVAALAGPSDAAPLLASVAPVPVGEGAPAPVLRDPRQVARVAEAVLRRDPRNAEARAGAIEAAVALRDLPAAEALLAEGRVLNGSDPRVSFAEARLARAQGDRRRAQAALQLAADQRRAQIGRDRPLAVAAAASGRRTMLAGDGQGSSFEPLDSNPAGAASGGVTPSQLRASEDPLLSEIGRQLAEVNEQAAGQVVPSFAFRTRSGTNGLERLREFGGGAEASVPLPGLGGELSARAQAVNLDTGRLEANLPNLRRFGTNPLALPGQGGLVTDAQAAALRPRDTSLTGASLGLAYARNGVTIDIGSTPLGFREETILGGIEVTPRLSDTLQLRLKGERRSVTDSILSWSGLRDSASGAGFGGVTRTTGRGQLEYFSDRVSAYAGGGYSAISGRNVADNSRIEASAGLGYALHRSPTSELTTGLDVTYLAYEKNLRNFTFGQGGYFSPQTYVNASIPVDYRERVGDFAYRLGASVGVANFREKSSPVFPNNPDLQAALEGQAAGDATIATAYGAQRATTVTAGVRADIEYALTPALRLGATARYDRSADFNETRALVYARYRFDP